MAQAVLKIQQWLNKTYLGRTGYTQVSEDGTTGWGTIKGLTTALQIELGISSPNGNFGPATAALLAIYQLAQLKQIKSIYYKELYSAKDIILVDSLAHLEMVQKKQ
ncbi:hypothetical protein NNC19_16125 [Clostridium sp. SHJSY1]|uniref:hypothetical protein n=1 Tax=Clostridium sp. SHJSY1 TaxID=2942483 RepID=UPI002875FC2F|nr:hypothetical protein [Clostridium sp. SHJSY1]MDS0527220.1 hypothetical protein [Clostridium sp. SHJSY1]